MAQVWEKLDDEAWVCREIDKATWLGSGCAEFADFDVSSSQRDRVLLCPSRCNGRPVTWMIVAHCTADVWINDVPLENGIRRLSDRDAIRLPGKRLLYFSRERLARIERFPDLDGVFCARCKLAIAPGTRAVRCPHCAVWHHEADGDRRLCWSVSENCALCDQGTEIDAARFRWTPEEL